MTARSYRRLTRYAAFALVHLGIVLALLVGPLAPAQAGLVLLLVSVPLLPAWGAFLGDVSLNPDLDAAERSRWLITLYLVPWSMALYWHLHVRGCSDTDA